MKKLMGLLRLTRPANIVTAVSDILAGAAIAGFAVVGEQPSSSQYLYWLVLSTVGLYGGGVVFNDVFDAALDRVERPERPIPSGLISGREAALLGSILLLAGIAAAFMFSPLSGTIAVAIAVAALVYDKWGKHHSFLGPINMGLCRGLDLLLGMSLVPEVITQFGFLAIAPILYIAAITMISRGEVHGGKSNTMLAAAGLYGVVILAIVAWSIANHAYYALIFLVLLIILIFPPLVRAFRAPIGPNIGKAVKAGVLALIIMNAAWAAATGAILLAVIIALLLPVSIATAKLFAVT
jgi:4-hydroxybenzoate polyprenyltransferase